MGPYAAFGQGVFGVEAAIEDINKQGGVNVKEFGKKIPVRLLKRDTTSDLLKGAPLAEDLILREKVHFFVNSQEPITTQIQKNNLCDKYKIPNVAGTGPLEPYLGVREVRLQCVRSIRSPTSAVSVRLNPGRASRRQ